VDKRVKTKSEITKECGIPFSILSSYLKNHRIRDEKHADLEFEWFSLSTSKQYSTVESHSERKDCEITLKLGVNFSDVMGSYIFNEDNIVSVCVCVSNLYQLTQM